MGGFIQTASPSIPLAMPPRVQIVSLYGHPVHHVMSLLVQSQYDVFSEVVPGVLRSHARGKDTVNPTEHSAEAAATYPTDRRGVLVVMVEPHEGYDELVNRWYDDEHLAERLEVPGILSARRYVAVEGEPKYLAMYELDTPAVVQGEAYLEKKRQPTALTEEVESHVRMIRGVYAEITPKIAGGPGPLPAEFLAGK
jgi:hypothetical protein